MMTETTLNSVARISIAMSTMIRRLALLPAVALILITASPLLAQTTKPAGDRVRLNAEAPPPAERSTFHDLATGKTAVEPGHKDILKRHAEYFIYRLTHEEYQFKKSADSGTSMKNLLDEASKSIPVPTPQKPLTDNQVRFLQEFGKPLVAAIKEVLNNERPIARVNAAIILARLGETGVNDFADAFCEVIGSNNYGDAVKLYALTGLTNLFRAKGEDRVKDEEREKRCVKALIDFINRKPEGDLSAKSAEEVEGLRYVRREAIRALGQSRLPAVGKGRDIQAIPSMELLRIVANSATAQPTFSLSERAEAAIGLAMMQRRHWPERSDYQPEYAGYYMGQFIKDFAAEYDKERGQPSATDWKHLAYRLQQALTEMKAEASGKFPKLDGIIGRSGTVLNGIIEGRGADQVALVNFLESNQPDAKHLLKDVASTSLAQPDAGDK